MPNVREIPEEESFWERWVYTSLKKSDWTYVDFYGGSLTDDYWDWAEAALQVVKALLR